MDDLRDLPGELRAVDQWILWRVKPRGETGKADKVPSHPASGHPISAHDAGHWLSFDDAIEQIKDHDEGGWGVGFVITADDPYCCIDLDDCLDDDAGLLPRQKGWLDLLLDGDSYVEWSPSGRGLHIWIVGSWRGRRKKGDAWEVYDSRRFMTMTGDRVEDCSGRLTDRQDALDLLAAEISPSEAPGSPVLNAKPSTVVTPQITDGPATGRLRALLDVSPKISQTWKRKRGGRGDPGFQDQSASAYCYALAQYMLRAGWSDQEICDALVFWRLEQGEDLKLARGDSWYARTIGDAHREVDADIAKEDAEDLIGDETASVEDRFHAINSLLGVDVLDIRRYPEEAPYYKIDVRSDEGPFAGQTMTAHLGSIAWADETPSGQASFRRSIHDVLRVRPRKLSAQAWSRVSAELVRCAPDCEIADGTARGVLLSAVRRYLARIPPAEKTNDRLAERDPVIWRDAIYYHEQTFNAYCGRSRIDLPKKRFSVMREAGMKDQTFSFDKTSVKYWRLPDDLFPPTRGRR